jgi:hypothetical protein
MKHPIPVICGIAHRCCRCNVRVLDTEATWRRWRGLTVEYVEAVCPKCAEVKP